MQSSIFLLMFASALLYAQSPDEKDALSVVQKTFDGMAAHDGATIRSTMLPDARLYAVRSDGSAASTAGSDFANQIAALKGDILERFTGTPTISVHGRIAQVWGEYEFLRDAKFGHCGVDSFSLFKTAEGWKIATIVYTMETTGCKGRPE